MAESKLTRVMNRLAGRLEGISVGNGYYTDIGQTVERYPRVFDQDETPACAVFLNGGDSGGSAGNGVKTDPTLTIRASHKITGIAEDIAIRMMADIHKAVEQPSSTIPQQPDVIRRYDETSWEIVYPENTGKVVSVELTYSFSYSRRYGED